MSKEKTEEKGYDPNEVIKEAEKTIKEFEQNHFGNEGFETVKGETGSIFKKLFS